MIASGGSMKVAVLKICPFKLVITLLKSQMFSIEMGGWDIVLGLNGYSH